MGFRPRGRNLTTTKRKTRICGSNKMICHKCKEPASYMVADGKFISRAWCIECWGAKTDREREMTKDLKEKKDFDKFIRKNMTAEDWMGIFKEGKGK